jgi:AcrR family transcriptional regulator
MKTRPYTMKARATATQETRQQILRSSAALLWEKLSPEIRLADVAARAKVSVQTILRHFGTRENLIAAAEDALREEIRAERQAPVGDIPAAVRAIFDHYETRGDGVLRLLAQEYGNEQIRVINDYGRRMHRAWVETVFGPQLEAREEHGKHGKHGEGERTALVDLLVVATDIYTWKLLRRDRALSRAEAEVRVRRLVAAILTGMAGDEEGD